MIFIDSGAFIALAIPGDQHHTAAVALHQQVTTPRHTLDSIVGESYTYLRYRYGQHAGLRFLRGIMHVRSAGELRVDYVDEALASAAEAILQQYRDAALSNADATALAWLRLHPEAKTVFSFDQHWRLEGHLLAL